MYIDLTRAVWGVYLVIVSLNTLAGEKVEYKKESVGGYIAPGQIFSPIAPSN